MFGWCFQTWMDYFPFHIWDVIQTPLTNSYFSRWLIYTPTSIYIYIYIHGFIHVAYDVLHIYIYIHTCTHAQLYNMISYVPGTGKNTTSTICSAPPGSTTAAHRGYVGRCSLRGSSGTWCGAEIQKSWGLQNRVFGVQNCRICGEHQKNHWFTDFSFLFPLDMGLLWVHPHW